MTDSILAKLHLPSWVQMPPPPQFESLVDKSWYYKTPDDYYIGLVFTSKLPGSNGRAMAVYHVRGEPKARNEKHDSVQQAMDAIQKAASELQLNVRTWQ